MVIAFIFVNPANVQRIDAVRRHDVIVPRSNAEYLHDLPPHSEIHPLDAGHYAWEEKADEYGSRIVDWVSGGYKRLAG